MLVLHSMNSNVEIKWSTLTTSENIDKVSGFGKLASFVIHEDLFLLAKFL